MKKLLLLIFFIPFALFGQKYNIHFDKTTNGVAAMRGPDSIFIEPPYANRSDLDEVTGYNPTYHIQLVGTTIYAYPGINTGYSIYSGSELADVINSVVAVVDSGAVIHIRDGHYNLTDSILLKSYVTYDFSSKARICVRGTYSGPVFYKPVATELRSSTVRGGYFYGKIGENRDWNFCNLRSNSEDYPAAGNRFLNISMFYLKTAFELVDPSDTEILNYFFSEIP
jgi:hypothetical protein